MGRHRHGIITAAPAMFLRSLPTDSRRAWRSHSVDDEMLSIRRCRRVIELMTSSDASLTAQIVEREPIDQSQGNSGNTIERVRLGDGRRLILKRVSPEWDWLSRATN